MSIEIFTSDKCKPCKTAKEILRVKGKDFREIDIDTREGERRVEEENIKVVPTIKKDGERVEGLSPEEIWDL